MPTALTPHEVWEHQQQDRRQKQALAAAAQLSPVLRPLGPQLDAILLTCQARPTAYSVSCCVSSHWGMRLQPQMHASSALEEDLYCA